MVMIRILCAWLICNFPLALTSQSDPAFLANRTPYRHLAWDIQPWHSKNPAAIPGEKYIQWAAGVTNHFGIRNFNTFQAGVSLGGEAFSMRLYLKHSPLPDNDYARTLGSLGASLRLSGALGAGLSLMLNHTRLPGDFGSGGMAGGMAGVMVSPSRSLVFGIGTGYLKTFSLPGSPGQSIAVVAADMNLRLDGKTLICISGEIVSQAKPSLMLTLVADLFAGTRLAVGVGNGRELMTFGFSFGFGNIRAGAASCFSPSAGRTDALFVAGKNLKG